MYNVTNVNDTDKDVHCHHNLITTSIVDVSLYYVITHQ